MEDVFKALASNARRRILNYLSHGSMTAGEIADRFDMTKPSISKHLSILRSAGLISEEKKGQFVHYRLIEENLVNCLYGFVSTVCPEARAIDRQMKAENGIESTKSKSGRTAAANARDGKKP